MVSIDVSFVGRVQRVDPLLQQGLPFFLDPAAEEKMRQTQPAQFKRLRLIHRKSAALDLPENVCQFCLHLDFGLRFLWIPKEATA